MAITVIGLEHPVMGIYNSATGEYANGSLAGGAVNVAANYQSTSNKMFANNKNMETVSEVVGGTINLTFYDFPVELRKKIFGHKTKEGVQSKGFTISANDKAENVGFGCIGQTDGGEYKALWYTKIKFAIPNDALATKAENGVTFQTIQLTGELMFDINGDLMDNEVFPTLTEAQTWLNTKAGITA